MPLWTCDLSICFISAQYNQNYICGSSWKLSVTYPALLWSCCALGNHDTNMLTYFQIPNMTPLKPAAYSDLNIQMELKPALKKKKLRPVEECRLESSRFTTGLMNLRTQTWTYKWSRYIKNFWNIWTFAFSSTCQRCQTLSLTGSQDESGRDERQEEKQSLHGVNRKLPDTSSWQGRTTAVPHWGSFL